MRRKALLAILGIIVGAGGLPAYAGSTGQVRTPPRIITTPPSRHAVLPPVYDPYIPKSEPYAQRSSRSYWMTCSRTSPFPC